MKNINLNPSKIRIVGILNLSPESFSGDGIIDKKVALERARELIRDGADIIDIGAQSTKPGSRQLTLEEELERLSGTIEAIKMEFKDTRVSIDTTRYDVMELAVSEGATILNDISGGRFDKRIVKLLIVNPSLNFILTHSQGTFEVMHRTYKYSDIVKEIKEYFSKNIDALLKAGVRKDQMILDPGIGFSKAGEQNTEIIGRLDELTDLDLPIYIGLSRKKFIGKIIGAEIPSDRDFASGILQCISIQKGATYIRTHNPKYVKQTQQILSSFYTHPSVQGQF